MSSHVLLWLILFAPLAACAIITVFTRRNREASAGISIAAAIFGIGLGGDYMIIPLMAADLFGVRILGRLMGVLLAAEQFALPAAHQAFDDDGRLKNIAHQAAVEAIGVRVVQLARALRSS